MVRADLLEGIDQTLRFARDLDAPFGGAQIIAFGDPFQLPPIVDDPELQRFFADTWGGSFFFDAPVWNDAQIRVMELQEVFRQSDPDFVALLNRVREGTCSEDDLMLLNTRVVDEWWEPEEGTVVLAPHNKTVSQINEDRLANLTGPLHLFRGTTTGNFDLRHVPADHELRLKVGAQVMFVRNDIGRRWQNGTLGVVTELDADSILVSVDGIAYSVETVVWEKYGYYYDPGVGSVETNVTGTYTQYPLKLAWATTIHKSQGQSFDSMALDLRARAFAPGQTYVALSRVTQLSGLHLLGEIQPSDIMVSPHVAAFFRRSREHKQGLST